MWKRIGVFDVIQFDACPAATISLDEYANIRLRFIESTSKRGFLFGFEKPVRQQQTTRIHHTTIKKGGAKSSITDECADRFEGFLEKAGEVTARAILHVNILSSDVKQLKMFSFISFAIDGRTFPAKTRKIFVETLCFFNGPFSPLSLSVDVSKQKPDRHWTILTLTTLPTTLRVSKKKFKLTEINQQKPSKKRSRDNRNKTMHFVVWFLFVKRVVITNLGVTWIDSLASFVLLICAIAQTLGKWRLRRGKNR